MQFQDYGRELVLQQKFFGNFFLFSKKLANNLIFFLFNNFFRSPTADDLNSAASRLQEHECRMMARGYPVQPVVGAGFCPVHWNF